MPFSVNTRSNEKYFRFFRRFTLYTFLSLSVSRQQNILLSKLSHRDSFESRFIEAIDVARPRDMTRNHVVSTEYSDKFLPPQIYR
ncbi:hypothetical protein WN51_03052 [Melipona quadrifasciata]|uniref:Uncharacterized protein n=1 Tax=Melipona quadrifasciata TaxID=166423 RepID=A0A0M8ZVP7_9HYME|nr:hypothetical protein WN51_03052 [Melipona quadrifasciata]